MLDHQTERAALAGGPNTEITNEHLVENTAQSGDLQPVSGGRSEDLTAVGLVEVVATFKEDAAKVAANGYTPVPVEPNSKAVYLTDWTTLPVEELLALAPSKPDHGIGLRLGDGLAVLDADTTDPVITEGLYAMWRIFFAAPLRVGAKGFGGLFRLSHEDAAELGSGEDWELAPGQTVQLLGQGRQLVAYGIHPNGRRYRWADGHPLVTPVSALPVLPLSSVRLMLTMAGGVLKAKQGDKFKLPVSMGPGEKHIPLVSRAAQLAALHYTPDALFDILMAENLERCKPPLPASEVRDIALWASNQDVVIATDQDAGEDFARRFHGDHRFGGGVWWSWHSGRWCRDDGGVDRAVRTYTRALEHKAQAVEDEQQRRRLVGQARKFQAASRHNAILTVAKTELPMIINPAMLDADPMLLNVANGVVVLTTGQLRSVERRDMVSKMAGIMFDPDARCPLWERCLDDWFQGDAEMIAYVRRCVGYVLTGLNREQVFFLLTGVGRNGKSVFLKIIRALVDEYAVAVSRKVMLASGPVSGSGPTPEVVALMGARLGTFSENDKAAAFNVETIKGISGDDRMEGRLCRENQVEFDLLLKLMIATNYLPRFDGADYAFAQRIHLWKFDHIIPEDQRDHDLVPKLMAELPGILNWAIAGCLEWQSMKLAPPKKVMEARDKYAAEMDRVGCFLSEHCTKKVTGKVKRSRLYELYRNWCVNMGHKWATCQQLVGDLERKGYVCRKTEGEHHILGLELTGQAGGQR